MRPKDLKPAFTWATRVPFLQEKILYVPEYYFEHQKFKMPPLHEVFGNARDVCVEYCSGNGDWIVERAKKHPEVNWIAVEKQFERIRKIFSKRENHQVDNLLIVCGEAFTFTKYYLLDDVLQEVYINFPDPWPKHRHAKHRLIQQGFIEEVSRVVVTSGKITCVTDDKAYCEEIVQLLLRSPLWDAIHPNPYFLTNVEGYGYSFFEALWRNLGKTIFHIEFLNGAHKNSCLVSPVP